MALGRTKRRRKRKSLASSGSYPNNIIQLQTWIRLKKPKLQISIFNDVGRGVKCLKNIEQGDEIIAVPLDSVIISKNESGISEIMNILSGIPQLALATFLSYETHLQHKSKYSQYLQALPESYDTLFYCAEREVTLLPDVLRQPLLQQTTLIHNHFQKLLQVVKNAICTHCNAHLREVFCFTQFVQSWFAVNTRAVYYEDDTGRDTLALVPFLDMFNHASDADVELHIDHVRQVYALRTLKAYRKYDQVLIKYGSHSSPNLLLEYGFILAENPNDFIEFEFSKVIESARDYKTCFGEITKLKDQLIKNYHLDKCLTKNKDECSWNLNGLLYVLVTRDQELSVLQCKTYSSNFSKDEWANINAVLNILISKKLHDLQSELSKMESVQDCSRPFQIAKDLIRKYIDMLT